MTGRLSGFTLIELMIVVAIIGILTAIAVPKFADLISKSREGATKGALSNVRSALQIYYGDNEGWFPTDSLSCLTTTAKYITEIPIAKLPGTPHPDARSIQLFSKVTSAGLLDTGPLGGTADQGGWAYFSDNGRSEFWGTFIVNCMHSDIKGTTAWTAF